MKIIEVQDQIEGGKVAFDLFKEKLQEAVPLNFTNKFAKVIWTYLI